MGANIKVESLGDFSRYDCNVQAVCRCGHRGTIDLAKLKRWFDAHRWDTRVHMVVDHLRCSRCGRRPVRVIPVRRLADVPEWGPRSEDDWRRVVKRLRG